MLIARYDAQAMPRYAADATRCCYAMPMDVDSVIQQRHRMSRYFFAYTMAMLCCMLPCGDGQVRLDSGAIWHCRRDYYAMRDILLYIGRQCFEGFLSARCLLLIPCLSHAATHRCGAIFFAARAA